MKMPKKKCMRVMFTLLMVVSVFLSFQNTARWLDVHRQQTTALLVETPPVLPEVATIEQMTQRNENQHGAQQKKQDRLWFQQQTTNSTFQTTRFTPHVQGIIDLLSTSTLIAPEAQTVGRKKIFNYDPHMYCKASFRIVVRQPYSVPHQIECRSPELWCTYLQHIFRNETTGNKILPYNVSFGESIADRIRENTMAMGNCLGSSSPNSTFTMNNFHELKESLKYYNEGSRERKIGGYVLSRRKAPSWEGRDAIPVFRGHPRLQMQKAWNQNPQANCPQDVGELGHRLKASVFSLHHPDLFNGAVSFDHRHPCLLLELHNDNNATNSNRIILQTISRMNGHGDALPPLFIKPEMYYTQYQTAVVLGGIGAAFRTAKHLMAGQAVVLQRFTFEEWFVPYMKEFVHYIPLRQNLSDMKERMEWIRDNPLEVRKIAENGRQFYWEYLSFGRNEEHWYELLWRLSEAMHEKLADPGPSAGWIKDVGPPWPHSHVPWVYQRDDHGAWYLSTKGNK